MVILRNAEVKRVLNSIGSHCPSDGRRQGASAAMPGSAFSVFKSLNILVLAVSLRIFGRLQKVYQSQEDSGNTHIMQGKEEACKKMFYIKQ